MRVLFCFTKPAKSDAYSTLTAHLNLTRLILSLQWPIMPSGHHIRQCRFRIFVGFKYTYYVLKCFVFVIPDLFPFSSFGPFFGCLYLIILPTSFTHCLKVIHSISIHLVATVGITLFILWTYQN